MKKPTTLTMKLDRNVLKHLGIKLYSSVPAVLSEAVANAWDADAEEVRIDICKENGQDVVIITDNGSGMTCDDLANKFLVVGYERRTSKSDDATPKHKRHPMGRKGIGKLSLFSIAQNIEVHSKKGGEKTAISMDRDKLAGGLGEYKLPVLPDNRFRNFPHKNGTCIVISSLDKKRTIASIPLLRKRLARRFTLPCTEAMKIILNGTSVTVKDRDYFAKLDYMFQYGDKEYAKCCLHLPENMVKTRKNHFNTKGEADSNGKYSIQGWIGFARPTKANEKSKPTATPAKQGENQVLVMVREKQAKADILKDFGISSFFGQYVFGEISADFLDETCEEDIATSSRQDIREDDPRYIALCKFMRSEAWQLQEPWDTLRSQEGMDKARELLPQPDFNQMLDDMSNDEKRQLRTLFGRINRVPDGGDKKLFACGLYVFERFRRNNALDALKHVDINNAGEFIKIAESLGELEAADYYAIAKTRLGVISKLGENVDINVLEECLKKLLYKNLWLLSPSWERATAPDARVETRVTKEFDSIDKQLTRKDKNALGRADIKYRVAGAAHVIVELKRASVNINSHRLLEQVEKYKKGLEKCLAEIPDNAGREAENVEVICILGGLPSDWKDLSAKERTNRREYMRAAYNTRIITYEKLMKDAMERYHDAVEAQRKYGHMHQIYSLALGENTSKND